jgi:integrase
MRSLFNYLNKHEGIDIRNPFNSVQKRKAITNIKTIEPEEFKRLLDSISPEQGEQVLQTGEKKNHYHPFLKDAFKLGLLTGLRREELVSIRFCDVEEDVNGQAVVIASNNLKRNRIMNSNETGDVKLTPVPVTPQLRVLLMEMGYLENKNSDKYILAPESALERKTLMDIISKSFSHYGKIAGLSNDISFRHLRKTFATKMQIVLGDNSHLVTGHATQKILTDHYVNKAVIARVASDKDIFPEIDFSNDDKKIEEIKNVREIKHKDISLER